jgi:hypothetical protein
MCTQAVRVLQRWHSALCTRASSCTSSCLYAIYYSKVTLYLHPTMYISASLHSVHITAAACTQWLYMQSWLILHVHCGLLSVYMHHVTHTATTTTALDTAVHLGVQSQYMIYML